MFVSNKCYKRKTEIKKIVFCHSNNLLKYEIRSIARRKQHTYNKILSVKSEDKICRYFQQCASVLINILRF